MFDIGFQEILVLMVVALLVFGPDKLPELGRRLGRALREFRRASDEFRTTVETNLQLTEESLLPPSASTSTAWSAATPGGASGSETAAAEAAPVPAAGEGGAAASGDQTAATEPAPAAEPVEPYWTRRGGRLLHRATCAWRSRVGEGERVPLKTASDGWDMGLRPCPVCDPGEVGVAS